MTEQERRAMFEAVVLQALWCLIMLAFGKKPRDQAINVRSSMLHYMDEYGNQSDKAKAYRRETSYPEIRFSE